MEAVAGLAGAAIGLGLARLLADAAVALTASTVSTLYVATAAVPPALESAIRATSASLDPRLRLYDMMTVDKLDKAGLATISFLTAVLTLLCGLALLLSTRNPDLRPADLRAEAERVLRLRVGGDR